MAKHTLIETKRKKEGGSNCRERNQAFRERLGEGGSPGQDPGQNGLQLIVRWLCASVPVTLPSHCLSFPLFFSFFFSSPVLTSYCLAQLLILILTSTPFHARMLSCFGFLFMYVFSFLSLTLHGMMDLRSMHGLN